MKTPTQEQVEKAKGIVSSILTHRYQIHTYESDELAVVSILAQALSQEREDALKSFRMPERDEIKKAMGGYITLEQEELLEWIIKRMNGLDEK